MHPPEEEKFSGAALIVEGGIIALLASNILKLTTGWQLDFVFNLALATLMILYLIRAASTFVDDANMARIRLTTPLSSICLQFCIIGAVANSAIYLSKFDGGLKPLFQQPVLKFILLAGLIFITAVTIDEIFLGEFINTWIGVIDDTNNDNLVDDLLQEVADWTNNAIESWNRDSEQSESVNYTRGIVLLILLGTLLIIGLIPLAYLGASLLGSIWTAIIMLFTLLLIRDLTRYLYFRFGPAQSFEEVKTTTQTTILVLLINTWLVTGALGISL